VKGKKCKDITKFLEDLGKTLAVENTSEFYQEEVIETTASHEHVRVEKK